MDFFKSVFSDEPEESSDPQKPSHSDPNSPTYPNPQQSPNPNPNPNPSTSSGIWSFGGLIKTIATRSESVMEIYRRDLEEFGSGLKKETEAIRHVTSRAVRDLPVSLEVGASAAQESLESVGHAIDEFGSSVWRGTTEIITQGKDALLDLDSDSSNQNSGSSLSNSKRYSRFDAQVVGIQSDPGTYSNEPDDPEDFKKWQSGFDLEEKGEEIENLFEENEAVERIYSNLVPSVVDHETFWNRYFYRIYKSKVAEDARVNLVRRAISMEDDEELSWEVEDNDEEETAHVPRSRDLGEKKTAKDSKKDAIDAEKNLIEENKNSTCNPNSHKGYDGDSVDSVKETISVNGSYGDVQLVENEGGGDPNSSESVVKFDEKVTVEGKIEAGDSSKDSDLSVVSSQHSAHEEEDIGWDEIEDLGRIDEKKDNTGVSPSREYLRKRLSAADEEEDLSWDIEEDEPVKN